MFQTFDSTATEMSSTVPEVQNNADLSGIIEKLMSNGTNHLHVLDKYIVPPHERPQMITEVFCYSERIPVVDLKDLDGPNRSRVVQEIRRACDEDGFFQIVNHGVPEMAMKNMMGIAKEFFEMPVEDRACLYTEDRNQPVRVFTSFNIRKDKVLIRKDKVLYWADYLRHPGHPLEEVVGSWPEKPAAYREIAATYAAQVRGLVLRLLAAISEALGLDSDYLNRIFGRHSQVMGLNYYPSCPNPDLTFGVPPHSDPSGITILMQDDVSGLQVLKNGNWVAVEPLPNAFVVNVADQLQVVSNGRFESVEHRAVTNSSVARISIPTFYGPSKDAFIAPAPSMVDQEHPPLYRGYKFEEFMGVFNSQELRGKTVLDHFKIEYQ